LEGNLKGPGGREGGRLEPHQGKREVGVKPGKTECNWRQKKTMTIGREKVIIRGKWESAGKMAATVGAGDVESRGG